MLEAEVLPFVGKFVGLRKHSGAQYKGTLRRTGRDRYALVRVTIINSAGGETTPKHGENRRIQLEKIASIWLEEVFIPKPKGLLMELTADNVNKLFVGSMFGEGVDQATMEETAIRVSGITSNVGFDPEKIAANKSNIHAMLEQLPDEFMVGKGGGMSFLQMCQTKTGQQWGEHRNMEQLAMLGMAAGYVELCLPREMWSALPGGMPYFTINLNGIEAEHAD